MSFQSQSREQVCLPELKYLKLQNQSKKASRHGDLRKPSIKIKTVKFQLRHLKCLRENKSKKGMRLDLVNAPSLSEIILQSINIIRCM